MGEMKRTKSAASDALPGTKKETGVEESSTTTCSTTITTYVTETTTTSSMAARRRLAERALWDGDSDKARSSSPSSKKGVLSSSSTKKAAQRALLDDDSDKELSSPANKGHPAWQRTVAPDNEEVGRRSLVRHDDSDGVSPAARARKARQHAAAVAAAALESESEENDVTETKLGPKRVSLRSYVPDASSDDFSTKPDLKAGKRTALRHSKMESEEEDATLDGSPMLEVSSVRRSLRKDLSKEMVSTSVFTTEATHEEEDQDDEEVHSSDSPLNKSSSAYNKALSIFSQGLGIGAGASAEAVDQELSSPSSGNDNSEVRGLQSLEVDTSRTTSSMSPANEDKLKKKSKVYGTAISMFSESMGSSAEIKEGPSREIAEKVVESKRKPNATCSVATTKSSGSTGSGAGMSVHFEDEEHSCST